MQFGRKIHPMDFVAKPDHFTNNDNGWWFDGIRSSHNIG
jgi:hypothetical protein